MPDCRLYLITPPALSDPARFAAEDLARALDAGDVGALQIRLKGLVEDAILRAAEAILPVAQSRGVAVLMNDSMALAKRSGCDGVHLGQQDGDPVAARKLLGAEATIGVTCHDSRHLAMEAGEAGADYVAFGAFFPTSTKETAHKPEPEILTWWSEMFEIPCVAIGGITPANAPPLIAAGADFIAVCSAVWGDSRGPAAAVTDFMTILGETR